METRTFNAVGWLVMIIALLVFFTTNAVEFTQGCADNSSPCTLVFVPGMSFHTNRSQIVLQNLELLQSSSNFHCLIHYYTINPPPWEMERLKGFGCSLTLFHQDNHYADYLKSLLPAMLKYSKFAYLMVLLDDVELGSKFRLEALLDIMRRNRLSVISPAIHGSTMLSTLPYKHTARAKQFRFPPQYTLGCTVQSIEIFATVFTKESWSCFWDLIEPRWNAAGWGYDLCFYNYCKSRVPDFSMGVVYTMTAVHHSELGRIQRPQNQNSRSIASQHPGRQFDFWLKEMKRWRNISLIPVQKNSRGKKLT